MKHTFAESTASGDPSRETLGPLERGIADVLSGVAARRVLAGSGALRSIDLVEELLAHGLLDAGKPRSALAAAVTRACKRLLARGLHSTDSGNRGKPIVHWSAAQSITKSSVTS